MKKVPVKKYLLLIPLVVSLIMLTFFSVANEEIAKELCEQKYNGIKMSLYTIATQIDRFVEEDDDWGAYDYLSLLKPMIEEIDAGKMIYAELFDHNLVSLSDRKFEIASDFFDPRAYDEFLLAVEEKDSGELGVIFDNGVRPPFKEHLYFRKMPAGNHENKYIAVVGVNRYSAVKSVEPWVMWGAIGIVAMTVLLQLWMIFNITKLADSERANREKGARATRKAKAGDKRGS